jgi:hypothetical protein
MSTFLAGSVFFSRAQSSSTWNFELVSILRLNNELATPNHIGQVRVGFESLSISRRVETMDWIGRDCRQSDRYRKNFGASGGGSLKKFEKGESAEPPDSNPAVDRFKSLFLRQKVAMSHGVRHPAGFVPSTSKPEKVAVLPDTYACLEKRGHTIW